ncbi:transglycosylase domain-containing protein [Amphibacillus sp. Q70]|uniref:transglycosylase domain-containing protein n=1 Tax=Amphibacillus sp. Q70 TaxID=3453416 RepID=UPI003F8414B7
MNRFNHLLEKGRALLKRPWFKWPVLIMSTFIGLSVIVFLFIIYGGRLIVDEKALVLPATTLVVTEDGDYAGRLYQENRQLVSLDEIPEHVREAFIAIEDRRFYSHAGVDFKSVMRAVYRDIITLDKAEGASTITQQLAKNLFLTNDKSWMRKTREVMATIYLERHYTKNDILAFYLNEVYFGHGIHGIGAAADYFFGKSVEELSVAEGALLAGIINAPNYYSPHIDEERALERRNLVISQMEKAGYLETEEMLSTQGQTLTVVDPVDPNLPWIDDYLELVIREAEELYQISRSELQRGGYQITVYLDPIAQKIAYEQVQNDDFFHGSEDDIEVAFALLDQEYGQLRAALGGRDFSIGDQHRAHVERQPGSVIKPLAVYGPALSEEYAPYTMLDDSERDYDGYQVRNVDEHYQGEVSMHDAVAVSKNTSAVWLLDQIGISTSKNYLEKMQMDLSDDDGLALGLGGLTYGLTPLQVAEGYRTFIHDGEWVAAHTIAKIEDRHGQVIAEANPITHQVFTKQAAWYMLRMLENVVDEGTAQAGEYSKALAGKTGTTQHPQVSGQAKDSWFAGVTPDYVTSLWIGYDTSDEEHYLTEGSRAPTELTKAILTAIDQEQPLTTEFTLPSGVEELPEPIELPVIDDLDVSFKLGGWRLIQAELSWTSANDERVIYHVYQVADSGDSDQFLGRVEGEDHFTLTDISVFDDSSYYVVPYNPLTDRTGTPSNQITLSLY